MGVVYEVLDRQRGQRAALKTLKELSPEALYRFKQEFRCLADLSHPNLISFYELFSSGDEWFFTMELVDGVNLQESLAPPALGGKTTTESGEETETNVTSGLVTVVPDGPSEASPAAAAADMARPTMQCDPDRLRALLCQLAEGLNALHAGGILHRDLKPANVMVTRDNRVVILDFGISQSLIGGEDGQKESGVAGTADFMSPEQAMGGVLTEASDWYAFGVILFHALTGIMPFPGATSRDRLQEKRRGEALRPSEVCGQIPADLDELCAALLRKDPGKRLSGVEVLRTLGSSSALEAGRPAQQAVFVGRAIEQARMREALALAESGPVLLCVRGKSGLGKSALVHKFLEEAAESSGTVVLSGRCYEQESVPFKALDSLMDGLGRFMRRLSRLEAADLMPRDAGALAQMFPVLANVPAIANAPRRKTEGLDIVTVRKRAGLALRELFSRIRDRRRLVIAIDDLHWGDVDSATLIEQLMEPPDPPPLLLLCSYRSGQEESSQFLQLLQQSCAHCRRVDIDLNPLTAAEVLELSRLMDSSSTIAPGKAEAIARECGGNVFFVREVLGDPQLEKDASGSLDSMIWNRTQRLPAKTRRLLELVAVSGRPIPLWLALRAADLEDEGFAAYTALRGLHSEQQLSTKDLHVAMRKLGIDAAKSNPALS